jgi:hypothetical protein
VIHGTSAAKQNLTQPAGRVPRLDRRGERASLHVLGRMKGLSGRTAREMRLAILEREGINVTSIYGSKTKEES